MQQFVLPKGRALMTSFHNFKSRNFKLSASNPKSKYVACLSVLSQISNCQGLGRKHKHEVLKTDRRIFGLGPESSRSPEASPFRVVGDNESNTLSLLLTMKEYDKYYYILITYQ